jgi:hypothetical protein
MKKLIQIIQIYCLATLILACNKSDLTPIVNNSEEYEVDAQLTINKTTKKVRLSVIKFGLFTECKDAYLLNADAASKDFGIALSNFNPAGGLFNGEGICQQTGLLGVIGKGDNEIPFNLAPSTSNKITKSQNRVKIIHFFARSKCFQLFNLLKA